MANLFPTPEPTPTDDLITHMLGDAAEVWQELMKALDDLTLDHPWRFYRDGGWLMKATKGKKTIAWVSVGDEPLVHFSTHFAERHRETLVDDELLPDDARRLVADTQVSGRLLSVRLDLRTVADIQTARRLMDLKLTLR